MRQRPIRYLQVLLVVLFVSFVPRYANAQLSGFNVKGDMGLAAGTQAPPGIAYGFMLLNYNTGRINNKDGTQVNASGSVNVFGGAPLVSVVTKKKFLGANYGFMIVLPVLNSALETPRFVSNPSAGLGDLYVVPVQLGWHMKQADATVSYGLFAPTGRYTAGADNNTGFGMWGHELNLGTTVYSGEKKTWHVATNAALEFHSTKRDSVQQVGNLLTLEGGVGRNFLHGLSKVGLIYYSQWKISDDKLGPLPTLLVTGRNSSSALGPEVTFPIVPKKRGKLYAIVTARYEWEVYARTTTQGNAFVVGVFFPLKPIKLGH